jgi:hypothetical protein
MSLPATRWLLFTNIPYKKVALSCMRTTLAILHWLIGRFTKSAGMRLYLRLIRLHQLIIKASLPLSQEEQKHPCKRRQGQLAVSRAGSHTSKGRMKYLWFGRWHGCTNNCGQRARFGVLAGWAASPILAQTHTSIFESRFGVTPPSATHTNALTIRFFLHTLMAYTASHTRAIQSQVEQHLV